MEVARRGCSMSYPKDPAPVTERLSAYLKRPTNGLTVGLGVLGAVMIAFNIVRAIDHLYLGLGLAIIAAVGFVIASIVAFDKGLRTAYDT